MKDLLFLAHRIPYPPNKGDKIRSFNILKYLCARYRVHLGAFVDEPDDWQYAEVLKNHCASVHLVPLHPKLALLRSAQGLLTGEALGIPYYRDGRMRRWVSEVTGRLDLCGVYVYSSTMAQYAAHLSLPSKVLDFCDVDSEKWRQYAERHGFPRAWVYGREARLLADEERRLAERFSAVVLVSNSEADLFRRVAPAASLHTHTVRNGVDTEYFDPKLRFDSPFKVDECPIVFTGAMDYWANVDAVQWFVKEVLPRVAASVSHARFYIVGSRPADAVLALGRQPNVAVTGTVPDVRPYLAHARAVVAPLRIARGIQNKVLEALAMGRPLVATGDALDGLDGIEVSGAIAANDPASFAAALDRALVPGFDVVERARGYVCEQFGWDASLRVLDRLLAPPVRSGAA